jgi:hypothetical protein
MPSTWPTPDHVDPPANAVRVGGLTDQSGRVHDRPRRRHRPALAHRAHPRGTAAGCPHPDDILDNITLYWLANTGVSAARLYWENNADFFNAKNISIPFAVSVFPDELYQVPRSWAERALPRNLIHYNNLDRAATSPRGNSRTCSAARCGQRSRHCV